MNIIKKLWAGTCKLLRDLALTLYDHPSKFICLSLTRLWASVLGCLIVVTWYREQYQGIKFSSWSYLVMAFTTCLTAYGLKKWKDGDAQKMTPPPDNKGEVP